MRANLFQFKLLVALLFLATPLHAATLSRGQTFGASETVTNTKLHNLVDNATISGISNADISNAAAIAYSKLALTGSIVNADISTSAAIAYSKLALTGAILNADLAGSIADSKLSTISTAGKVSGAALTSLSSIPSGAGVIPVANLATGTPTGSKFVRDDGTLQAISNLSNVLFQYQASTDLASANQNGEIFATTLTNTSVTPNYRYFGTNGSSATTVLSTKWKKISGVSTITIYAQLWTSSTNTGTLTVNVGSANGNTTRSNTTPGWVNFTIDVSGLSDGTVYDVTYQLTTDNSGNRTYMGTLIAFGS